MSAASAPDGQAPDTLALHTSYFTLNAAHRTVRDALIDAHAMHRLIMSGWRQELFPGEANPRADIGVLYALSPGADHKVRVITQAQIAPTWVLPEGVLLGAVDDRIRSAPLAGTIAFQLTAAPRKSIPSPHRLPDGTRPRGRQIPLPAADREAWGRRALTRAGLDVHTLIAGQSTRLESESKSLPRNQRTRPGAVFAHTTVTYTGTGTITDPDAHKAALIGGVGPAKAYGCGLLLTRATGVGTVR